MTSESFTTGFFKYSLHIRSLSSWKTLLYTHIRVDVSRNITTHFNERTSTLLYKNISLTLYSKGLMLVVCER